VLTIGGGVVLDAAPIPRLKQTIVDTLLAAAIPGFVPPGTLVMH